MKLLIGRLIYALPGVAHGAILWLTGYRVIQVRSGYTGFVIDYIWTRQWPLTQYLIDRQFPAEMTKENPSEQHED